MFSQKKWDVVSITPAHRLLDSRANKFHKTATKKGLLTCIISNFGKEIQYFENYQTSKIPKRIGNLDTQKLNLAKQIWNFYKNHNNLPINALLLPALIVGYISRVLYINFFRIKFFKSKVLIVHEAFFLPLALVHKFFYKSQIIVDVHDDYRNIINKQNSTMFHIIFKNLFDETSRRILYKIANIRITVSHSLAQELKLIYARDFEVIRNINSFFIENENLIKKQYLQPRISSNSVYRGIFIGNNKNSLKLDWLYDEFWNTEKYEFNFFGNGYDSIKLVSDVQHVRFHQAIDFNNEFFDFNDFDFGFIPLDIQNKSVKYALPNGFFTLNDAQLPILMPNIIELDSLNKKYNIGRLSNFQNAKNVYKDLAMLIQEYFECSRKNILTCEIHDWNAEEKIFIKLLDSLLN